jgi:hypothetical protein
MDAARTREWHMFLGTREPADAAGTLARQVERLDEAHDVINYVVRLLAGSPDGDLEDELRMSRTVLNEGIRRLQDLVNEFRRDGTGAA